jgi:hypothetical protein
VTVRPLSGRGVFDEAAGGGTAKTPDRQCRNHYSAKTIRTFVASVVDASEGNIDPDRVQRWNEWALLQAEKLDPIATGAVWDDVNDRE